MLVGKVSGKMGKVLCKELVGNWVGRLVSNSVGNWVDNSAGKLELVGKLVGSFVGKERDGKRAPQLQLCLSFRFL